MTGDVFQLLDQHANRIDILMKETSDSPRRMSTVSTAQIAQSRHIITIQYQNADLIEFLSQPVATDMIIYPWDGEKFVINRREKRDDTHGWPWGDYPYAMIRVIKAPDISAGGMLQCIASTSWDKANPQVHQYLCDNPIYTYPHTSGDIYFLKSDTMLHRTAPLNIDEER